MELLWLRYFETAARLENMTRAAEFYRIPQSAMSQTIARLERELGVKLFDREKRRVRLNDNGRRFLDCVSPALARIDEGVRRMASDRGEAKPVRILVMQDREFVHDGVCTFSKENSEVSFDVHYGTVSEEKFDLYITDAASADRFEHAKFLFEEEVLLAMSEDSPLATKESVTLSDAMKYPLIFISDGFPLAEFIEDILARCSHHPPSTIRCQDPHMVNRCIAAGLGVSFSPVASWRNTDFDGIRLVRMSDLRLNRSTYLCWNGELSGASLEFKDHLLARAKVAVQEGNI